MTEFRDDPDADKIGAALSRLLGAFDESRIANGEGPLPWPATGTEAPPTLPPSTEPTTPPEPVWLPAVIEDVPTHQVGPVRVRGAAGDAPEPAPPFARPAAPTPPTDSPSEARSPAKPWPAAPTDDRPPPPAAEPSPRARGQRVFAAVPPRPSTEDSHPIRGTRSILSTLLRQRRRILLSTAIVALGVAYLAGSLSLLGRVSNGLDDLAGIGTERADVVIEGQIAVDTPFEQTRQLVPHALVPLISRLPGVAAATGRIEDTAVLIGPDLKPIVPLGLTQQPLAANWPTPASLNPYRFVGAGHAPVTPDQVVIDEGTARRAHLVVGATVSTWTKTTARPFTIVGIFTQSGRVLPKGSSLALFDTATARSLFDRADDDNSIGIKFTKDADRPTVLAAIKRLIPPQDDVVDGPTYERDRETILSKSFELVRALLIGFAGLAVVVGAFTVANSNTLLFARRRQGFAMLRLVGASPAQLGAAALIEAVLVGLAAVVVGIPLGMLVGAGIEAALGALGAAIPTAGSPLSVTVVAVSAAVGLGVTLVTAALPARDAARSSPLVALTKGDARVESGWPTWLRLAAWVVGGAVFGALLGAEFGEGAIPPAIGAGAGVAIAVFVWALPFALGRLVAVTTTALIGPSPALRSLTALRSRRARSRAAATTGALLIATAVVAGLSTLSSSFVASISDQVGQIVHADLVVDSGTFTRGGLPEKLVQELPKVPGVTASSGLRVGTASIGTANIRLSAVDGEDAFRLLRLGIAHPPSRLTSDGMLVSHDIAASQHLRVGQFVDLRFENADIPMKVQGIYTARSLLLGDAIIDTKLLDRVTPASVDLFALVTLRPSSRAAATTEITRLAQTFGVDHVYPPSELVDHRADVLRGFEQVIQWMLLFSVAIAVIGVANTLQLSVNERRRELGLLRAVGGSPGQVIRLVLVEAAALSLVGAVVGTALGLAVAFAAVRALAGLGLGAFDVPVVVILGTAVAAFAFGLIGAWLPALAASRTGVMDALGEDDDQHGSGLFDALARYRTARRSRRVEKGPGTGPRGFAPPADTPPEPGGAAGTGNAGSGTEESMARCYNCGNDPGSDDRCAVCGAMQIREPVGMFSTAPAAPATEVARQPAPMAHGNGATGATGGRWSTGDGDEPAPPAWETMHESADIVDAAVIDVEDDDDHVVNLGSIFDEPRVRGDARGPRPAGPPPESAPRMAQPTQAHTYDSIPGGPAWQQQRPAAAPPPPATMMPAVGETFGTPPPAPAGAPAASDPQGAAAAITRLAPSSQQNGAAAFMVAAALLGPDERVLGAVQGWSNGVPAVALLTTMRAVVVCERQWKPVVENFPLRPSLAVYGRHLEGRASMTFQDGDHAISIDQIADVSLAVELANTTRAQSMHQEF